MNEVPETQEVPEGMAPEMAAPAKKKRVTVGDVDTKLKELDSFLDEEVITAIDQLEARMEALEIATGALADALRKYGEGIALWGTRMEECEDSTHKLLDSWTAFQRTPPEPELEFAKPPEQPAGGQVTAGDIEMVASVCLTMNDVLTICRALKEAPDLDDQDKIRILNIACKTAGVEDTVGLRIRAGISATESAARR